jgi:hypothetical protein
MCEALPLVTESNAEPYMDRISGQLTLVGFETPSGGNRTFVPAFSSIYGAHIRFVQKHGLKQWFCNVCFLSPLST